MIIEDFKKFMVNLKKVVFLMMKYYVVVIFVNYVLWYIYVD